MQIEIRGEVVAGVTEVTVVAGTKEVVEKKGVQKGKGQRKQTTQKAIMVQEWE